MLMYCDNQTTIFIAGNPTFHECMKHIEVNCHYIQDKVMFRLISTPHVSSSHKLVDIFMKSLTIISYDDTCTKLDIFDLYAPT
ncbi:unnamed protein product [Spirodela intermedia]|uniref:Uncharacterized protein n=2 Tax=Spirodela intermedia TaxID=51605 RepID=A0A7I8IZN9_SPIIN|nr:unnamed protein product [Spirodela intermedia]CAA6662621.1 unnamed protein product [Spirodela intermedia]CAA7399028.1 unnamed protein product [Spirodela intermedia]